MIEMDGSFGEGGGQILRTSLALSVITQRPFEIHGVRKARKPSGLQPQHLMAVRSVVSISNSVVEGDELHSQRIIFYPQRPRAGDYFFDIQTAGSAILVLQTLLPILIFLDDESVIKIVGGTHLPKSPSFDYFEQVFLPAVKHFGVLTDVSLERSGYYPRGGGSVTMRVKPTKLRGCQNWQVKETKHAIIRLGSLPYHIAEREEKVIREAGFSEVRIYEESTFSPGNAVLLWQGLCGATGLGKLGKPAETVAQETIDDFLSETSMIDYHLADQLLLYAALAEEPSAYTTSHFSDHLTTQVYVLEKFLDKKIMLGEGRISTF